LLGAAQEETKLGGNWRNFWGELEVSHAAAAVAAQAAALKVRWADVAAATAAQAAAEAGAQRQGALAAKRLLAEAGDQRFDALATGLPFAEVEARRHVTLAAESQLAEELPRCPMGLDLANDLSPRWAVPVDPASPPSPGVQVDAYEKERLDLQAILKATMAQGPQEQGSGTGCGVPVPNTPQGQAPLLCHRCGTRPERGRRGQRSRSRPLSRPRRGEDRRLRGDQRAGDTIMRLVEENSSDGPYLGIVYDDLQRRSWAVRAEHEIAHVGGVPLDMAAECQKPRPHILYQARTRLHGLLAAAGLHSSGSHSSPAGTMTGSNEQALADQLAQRGDGGPCEPIAPAKGKDKGKGKGQGGGQSAKRRQKTEEWFRKVAAKKGARKGKHRRPPRSRSGSADDPGASDPQDPLGFFGPQSPGD
jgi:hypothetical protein